MPFEKSAGCVVYKKEKGEIFYLLLNYPSRQSGKKSFWEFPKGHIEEGESELETAARETKEETGITNLVFEQNFKEWIKYYFKAEGKNIFKVVIFFLAQAKTDKVALSHEHIGYGWYSFQEAEKKIKFPNSKKILKKANDYLLKM